MSAVSIGAQNLNLHSIVNVAYNYGPVIIETASLKQLPTEKDKKIAILPETSAAPADECWDVPVVRAIMLVRLQSLLSARNVRGEIIEGLGNFLNAGLTPKAGSGMFGVDVVGYIVTKDGKTVIANAAIAELPEPRFETVIFGERELKTFLRGTVVLSSLAALAHQKCDFFLNVADCVSALTCEAVAAFTAPFDAVHHDENRPHKGEVLSAGQLRLLLESSKLADSAKATRTHPDDPSIRCIPQVHGAARDAISHALRPIQIELNSYEGGKASDKNDSIGEYATEPVLLSLSEVGKAVVTLLTSSLGRLRLMVNEAVSYGLPEKLLTTPEQADVLIHYIDQPWIKECEMLIDKIRKYLGATYFLDPQKAQVDLARVVYAGSCALGHALESELVIALQAVSIRESKLKEKKKKKDEGSSALGQGTGVFRKMLCPEFVQITDEATLSKNLAQIEKTMTMNNLDLNNWMKNFLSMASATRKPKIPKGTRDFSGAQMTIRDKAFSIIKSVFERHGAVTIDTPVFELKETLMGKYGEESKLIYELADQGGELLALRYDLTVPFARYLAMNPGNIKRYHIAKVYRRDNPAMNKGRFREFYQCDFDIAGTYGSMIPDAEVVRVVTEILDALELGGYVLKLSHRGFLDAMIEMAGIPREKFNITCSSIDKLDKEPWTNVRKELVEEKGITEQAADFLGTYVQLRGEPLVMLNALKENKKFEASARGKAALEEMETLFNYLDAMGSLHNLSFDLSLARGLDYYTGLIYEAVLTKEGVQVGSIAGGGRYDKLVGLFSGKDIPAVGVSIGIERIFTILEEQIKAKGGIMRDNKTQVYVSSTEKDDELFRERLRVCNLCWQANVAAEYTYSTTTNLRKQLVSALEGYIPVAIIILKNEQGKFVYNIKNLIKQEQREVPVQAEILACKGLTFTVPAADAKKEEPASQ